MSKLDDDDYQPLDNMNEGGGMKSPKGTSNGLSVPENKTVYASGGSAARTKEEEMEMLVSTLQKKVDSYDPDEGKEGQSEFAKGDQESSNKIMFKYTNFSDNYSYYLGIIGALGMGSVMPVYCLNMGNMIQGMGE